MKQMHLVGFMHSSHVVLSHAIWRHPQTELGFLEPEFYQNIAQILERGKFDMVFFADVLSFPDRHGNSFELGLKYGAQGVVRLDPILTATAMALATQSIGIGITRSTSYYQPYDVAWTFSTLDHLSRGRAAWNIVTSNRDSEARNFSLEKHLEHDLRYERATEFVEVVTKLWDSWQDEALILDKESGIFADPAKVNYVHHVGEWFKVRGPLTVPRSSKTLPKASPQKRPVLIQAGGSERGKEFAAQWGEVIFEIKYTPAQMKAFYQYLKSRLSKYGRSPDECKILPTVMPFIGETEAMSNDKPLRVYAKEKQALNNELIHPEVGIFTLSNHMDYDFSQHDLDAPIADVKVNGVQSTLQVARELSQSQGLTLRDIGKLYGQGVLVPAVVGTPTQIADQLEALFRDDVCDGFVISPAYLPGSFTEFVNTVVPELQRRGLFRTEYTGSTLKDHMGIQTRSLTLQR